MWKLMVTLFLVTLISFSSLSFAAKFKQTIKLEVRSTTNQTNSICFKTTDVFDSLRCGNTYNNYDKGPKNWYLANSNTSTIRLLSESPECQILMDPNHTSRTPEEQGTLTIKVRIEKDYEKKKLILSECSTSWKSDVVAP